jgi:hypothetical protein
MARIARSEEVALERRRRQPGSLDRMDQLTLVVPDEVKEANPDHEFRFVVDNPRRMHGLTVKDDWDKVDGVAAIPDGIDKHGNQINMVLVKKRKEFCEADRREKLLARHEQTKQLERAPITDPQDTRSADVSYVPAGNSITTGFTP